nr:ribonuclease H-like domain-containing protein [Tanacetum cinerariifolium]
MSALKLLMLKTEDYDLWSMRMEQYLTHTNYALWEAIMNGDAPAVIASEDANLKLLRILPSACNTHTLIMQNKYDLDTLSMDDLYNNLKVYEAEIKGQSSSSSNYQNVDFVSSDNTSIIASVSGGTEAAIPPKTTEQKIARRNELKAKSTLMLAILDEHLLKFHRIKDEKTLWEAIKT